MYFGVADAFSVGCSGIAGPAYAHASSQLCQQFQAIIILRGNAYNYRDTWEIE